jgi:hypothetical protein
VCGAVGSVVNIAPNEQHLGLFADRTRTAAMRATRLYFWFAAIARVPVPFGAALMMDGVADTPPGPPFCWLPALDFQDRFLAQSSNYLRS